MANVAKKHNVIIIADEIYAELDFTTNPLLTIILKKQLSALSKWCGAGGWRLGMLIFPDELSRSVASETFTAVSAPIQYSY